MGKRLFIGNLSFDTNDDALRDAFSKAGTIRSASVVRDRMTGRSRGFGFVEMDSDDEAMTAMTTLNGLELDGRNITVSEARERTAGPRPPFRGGAPSNMGYEPPPYGGGGRFKKEGGSRRGLRARKRSL